MPTSTTPIVGASKLMPNLPKPCGRIDVREQYGLVRSVDGFSADQMHSFALKYAENLARAAGSMQVQADSVQDEGAGSPASVSDGQPAELKTSLPGRAD